VTDIPSIEPNEMDLLLEALDLATGERAAYLDRACQGNSTLRSRIQQLLNNVDETGNFMAAPVVDLNATTPMDAIQVGCQVDRYRLMEQIGEGGMGVVFVAEQTEPLRRKVALKVIKPGMDSKAVIARFEAERQVLALMDHPNISRVLDAGTTRERLPYFVMELVRGLSITKYCDQAKVSVDDRLRLFIDVCGAVQHAHQKGIIHRDLKPSNIMVTLHDGKPVVKIIDFGVAKALHQQLTEHTIYTALNQVVGTPLYMSPEQLELSGLDIDTRSDIYSLGVLLYELISGTTPFDRERLLKSGFDEFRRIIREEDPPPPSYRITTLPKAELSTAANRRGLDDRSFSKAIQSELDWITLKALEKDRNRRFESASLLRADIQRYLNNEPVLACPPSRRYRFLKWVSRHRVLVGATAVVVLSLLAGLIGTSLQTRRAWRAEALAETRFEDERIARVKADQERARANQERQRADVEADRSRRESSRAQEEAAVASAISQFLQSDLLAQIDITNQLSTGLKADPDITLATLLDRASEKINGRFSELPAVEGSIRYTLAKCYRSLGKYDLAMKHIQRAVELGRTVIGVDHPGTLRAICVQGDLAQLQGDLETAEALLLEAQQGIVNNGDASGEDGRMLLGHLLVLRFEQGRHEDAKSIATELVALCQTGLGPEAPETLITMSNLAIQYSALGDLAEADALQRKVYEVRLRTLGSMHPDTLGSLKNLAVLCDSQGDYQRSQALFEQAAEGYTSLLGKDHPDTLFVKANLGHVLTMQSKLNEAEELLLDTIGMLKYSIGEKHGITMTALQFLASVYESQGRFPECLEIRQTVFQGLIELRGEKHPDVISARANYATILRKLNRTDEANDALQLAIESARNALGNQHPLTLTMLNNLAVSYYDAKQYERALVLFKEIEQARIARQGQESVDVLSVRINLASVLAPLGRQVEARQLLHDTLARADSIFGEAHPLALLARQKLAEQIEADESLADRLTQAEVLHRRLFDLYTNIKGLEHPSTVLVMRRLVANLLNQDRVDDALTFCHQQISTANQAWSPDDHKTLYVRQSLAYAFFAAGNAVQAEPLYREMFTNTQRLKPDDSFRLGAIIGLVDCLNRLKRHQEAQQLIEVCIRELPPVGEVESNATRHLNRLMAKTIKLLSPEAALKSADTKTIINDIDLD